MVVEQSAARRPLTLMRVDFVEDPAEILDQQCPGCGYVYDEAMGAPREGFRPGTPWAQVPDSWTCPDCGVREKLNFVPIRKIGA